ncbi:MAG: permease [Hyphomicrobiales bacterium]|nr:MAG: permease [Hyphomicrobiales bacterium]
MTQVVSANTKPLTAVLMVACAVFLFAISDVLAKHLMTRHPVPLVVAIRYFVSLILILVVLWPRYKSRLWQTQRTRLVVARGFVLAFASLTMGLALRLMPVGETIAILYLSPFAVMLLSIPLLGERSSAASWIGAIIGFTGVMLIMRPGSGLDPVGVAFALVNAACGTAYLLMTRMLAKTETAVAMLFHVTVVGTVFFGLSAIPSYGGPMPDWTDLSLMVVLGATATTGHFLLTIAYRDAPASLLAPVNYMHLVWAAILGWFVFDHLPDNISLFGMALICVAGVAVALRAHLVNRKLKSAAAPAQ